VAGAAVRFEREVPLVVGAGEAWRALSALPPARGSAAGYDGTAVLEEADEDARTATLRLQGAAGRATVAATAAVTVLDGSLAITAVVRHGLGGPPLGEQDAEDALGHLATTLAYALATAGRPRSAWDKAVPPARAPAEAWDTPSPPPPRDPRDPIPAGATLTPAAPAEVLTPRPRDVVHPGQEPAPEADVGRWVKVGVAAAAGLAVLRVLRGRR
jgi:hypothetical protein